MTIYTATANIEVEMVVEANSEEEARAIASRNVDEGIRNVGVNLSDFDVREIDTLRELPWGWTGECSPYTNRSHLCYPTGVKDRFLKDILK